MTNEEKQMIWEHLSKRSFPWSDNDPLFILLKNNLHRIVFVKDHIGLPDVLFIREEGTSDYYPIQMALGLNVPLLLGGSFHENLEGNLERFFSVQVHEKHFIQKKLALFFEKTDRPLYFSPGLLETTTPHIRNHMISVRVADDETKEISMYELLINASIDNKKASSPLDAIRKMKLFPDWYDRIALMPEDLLARKLVIEEEKKQILLDIHSLFHPTNENPIESKSSSFHELAKRYRDFEQSLL